MRARADLLAKIRAFFSQKNVLEVDVPLMGATTVSDPNLSSITAEMSGQTLFLQTSPEFFMKRLLSSGSGSIYSLGKAFRDDERGRRHNPEFTMLEWYRVGFDEMSLAREVIELVRVLAPDTAWEFSSYEALFLRHVGVNPHLACPQELQEVAVRQLDISWSSGDKSEWLDLLFSHLVEPHLDKLTVVSDYPACQCALARIEARADGIDVAKRFEVYWKGVELANGYWELTDANTQRQRFIADLDQRKALNRPVYQPDEKLLSALASGMPECAGVALGVDRLIMCVLGVDSIEQVLAFPVGRL